MNVFRTVNDVGLIVSVVTSESKTSAGRAQAFVLDGKEPSGGDELPGEVLRELQVPFGA